MYGLGKVVLTSIFASGSLAMPWPQEPSPDPTMGISQKQPTTGSVSTGPSTQNPKQSGTGGTVGVGESLPTVSNVGPAYSLLLAKEIAPTDLDGVIVVWAYGVPFCTQRQTLSESIEDFCNTNLTFNRVPKLDENLQSTGQVTQISGYFTGCSDDVSLGRSYASLYWVEVVGMYDGVGDQSASAGGADGIVSKSTNTNLGPVAPLTTPSSTLPPTGTGPGGVSGPVEPPKTAYKCNRDREVHECPIDANSEVNIIAFASCGQYAYTDIKGVPGTFNSGAGTTPPTSKQ